ncbi:MAG: hypothetical protein J5544_00790 [Clostridia bacterium]|nr:hypothetical protein [Clostridia bacterium]
MKKTNRIVLIAVIAALLPLALFLCACSGSVQTSDNDPTDRALTHAPETDDPSGSEEPGFTETPVPTEEPFTTPEPTELPTDIDETPEPTEEPPIDQIDIDAILKEHGIDKEELRGEEVLFRRFAAIVENNAGIADFKHYVYKLFPVIADNADNLDSSIFLVHLARLTFEIYPDLPVDGTYSDTVIGIRDPQASNISYTVYHELMHFVDEKLNANYTPSLYRYRGGIITGEEYEQLSEDDQHKCKLIWDDISSAVIEEGGTELMAAKYFTKGPSEYIAQTAFAAGLEYILGSDQFAQLYFSGSSDWLFLKLLLDSGNDYDSCLNILASLRHFTNPLKYAEPDDPVAPEDILIDLYEQKLDGSWTEDNAFLYILKVINGIGGNGWRRSKYASALEPIEFRTPAQYTLFEEQLKAQISFDFDWKLTPPCPFMMNGALYIGAPASWADAANHRKVSGAVIVRCNFDTNTVVSFQRILPD